MKSQITLSLKALGITTIIWLGGLATWVMASQADCTATVYRLYKDYAWTAFLEPSGETARQLGKRIDAQPKNVLNLYFDSQLTALILNESECSANRSGTLCNLDFDLMFASQDIAVVDMEIAQEAEGRVRVTYKDPASKQGITMIYLMTKTKSVWKISDILYVNFGGVGLKQILSRKTVGHDQ